MHEPLLTWYQHFAVDAQAARRRLAGRCVLVYEPPERSDEEFQFQTSGGVFDVPMGGSEPVVATIEKTQSNAFQRRVTIGRTSNNDIEIADASVSRFHAWLEKTEDGQGWQLADAASRNGTQVAGRRLEPRQPQVLTPGQKLKVGGVALTYHSPESFFADLERRSKA